MTRLSSASIGADTQAAMDKGAGVCRIEDSPMGMYVGAASVSMGIWVANGLRSRLMEVGSVAYRATEGLVVVVACAVHKEEVEGAELARHAIPMTTANPMVPETMVRELM